MLFHFSVAASILGTSMIVLNDISFRLIFQFEIWKKYIPPTITSKRPHGLLILWIDTGIRRKILPPLTKWSIVLIVNRYKIQ